MSAPWTRRTTIAPMTRSAGHFPTPTCNRLDVIPVANHSHVVEGWARRGSADRLGLQEVVTDMRRSLSGTTHGSHRSLGFAALGTAMSLLGASAFFAPVEAGGVTPSPPSSTGPTGVSTSTSTTTPSTATTGPSTGGTTTTLPTTTLPTTTLPTRTTAAPPTTTTEPPTTTAAPPGPTTTPSPSPATARPPGSTTTTAPAQEFGSAPSAVAPGCPETTLRTPAPCGPEYIFPQWSDLAAGTSQLVSDHPVGSPRRSARAASSSAAPPLASGSRSTIPPSGSGRCRPPSRAASPSLSPTRRLEQATDYQTIQTGDVTGTATITCLPGPQRPSHL